MVGTGSAPPTAAAASQSWRTPSEANQAKYSLVPLPESFQLTREEETLLGTYETIRMYEKEAVRLKEEAARAKLAAKDAEFKQQQNMDTAPGTTKNMSKKKAKREKISSRAKDDDGSNADDMDNNDDESDASSAGNQSLNARREAKLAAMREELEDAKQTADDEEEALRSCRTPCKKRNGCGRTAPHERRWTTCRTVVLVDCKISEIYFYPNPRLSQKLGIKAWHGKSAVSYFDRRNYDVEASVHGH